MLGSSAASSRRLFFLCGSHAILMPMVAASNLPAPLTNGELIQTALLDDVPSSDELAQWLLDKGLDTTDWGKENTKDVSKFWKAPWSLKSGSETEMGQIGSACLYLQLNQISSFIYIYKI